MTHMVYPGALHTRFHHLLGALHLAMQAISGLKQKGVEIAPEEEEGFYLAILLHDIGHGPFSHALESRIVPIHHEQISLMFMKAFNTIWPGSMDLAISIFTNRYPKTFLYQLISGQVDLDRMDYLKRDSFYTGVAEGVIGHDRIIKMLNVVDNQLVIEEKGIYSIEKFLVARRLMYWQVYLHKTSLAAELMLQHFWERLKQLVITGQYSIHHPALNYFINEKVNAKESEFEKQYKILSCYALLDDIDIEFEIKQATEAEDELLRLLAFGLNNRQLFRLEFNPQDTKEDVLQKFNKAGFTNSMVLKDLIWQGIERNQIYQSNVKDEIIILSKKGDLKRFAEVSEFEMRQKIIEKKFICYPKKRLLLRL